MSWLIGNRFIVRNFFNNPITKDSEIVLVRRVFLCCDLLLFNLAVIEATPVITFIIL